ncbi:unnamed protein product, partial [marine sediment metagenome]
MLQRFSAGLLALSGCSKGEIPTWLERRNVGRAREAACFCREIFGEDFFVELIRYPSGEGMTASYRLATFAREENLPIVATNNVHYAEMEEYVVKELLNAIDQNVPVSELKCCRTVEQYLKSPKEMASLFRGFPQALATTEEVASRCNLELELGNPRFPEFTVPRGETDYSYLSRLTFDGALRKYGALTPKIRKRLEFELDTIRKLGFCSYFLVVWDI